MWSLHKVYNASAYMQVPSILTYYSIDFNDTLYGIDTKSCLTDLINLLAPEFGI